MVSILHRVSGAALFLASAVHPLAVRSQPDVGAELRSAWSSSHRTGWSSWSCWGLIWAFLHHLIAGIRYLLLDLHIGVDKPAARTSALAVFWISVPLTLLVALKLFGAF